MNIIKIGFVLLTGAGLGFGVDKLAENGAIPSEQETYYDHFQEGYCHGETNFFEHMLEDLSEEDAILVQTKIDELLIAYEITLEELNDDYEIRYAFMSELMDFLEENEIDYYGHGGFHNHDDENGWHGGMGMH